MQISIHGKQIDPGDALRQRIETELPRAIGKYFDRTTHATVTISRQGATFSVHIQVHVSKRVLLQAQGEATDAIRAYDIAADHILKRLRRQKRRLRDDKHDKHTKHGADTAADAAAGDTGAVTGTLADPAG